MKWRTTESIGNCITCGWGCMDRDHPRVTAAEAVQHKRAHPDHDVYLDREQTRRIEISESPDA
jgi:hypothetical protein